MKNQEVEIRALLKSNQVKTIREFLAANANYISKESLTDTYFCKIDVNSFSELEMEEVGSFSLRLRKVKANGNVTVQMNTKVITQFNDHSSWREHEVTLDSYEEASAILKSIGFKSFFSFEKKRDTYKYNDILVNLEEIYDYGSVIELEVMTTQQEAIEAKIKMNSFLDSFGITKNQISSKSITNTLMRERVKF